MEKKNHKEKFIKGRISFKKDYYHVCGTDVCESNKKKCICELMRGHHKTNENFFNYYYFLNVCISIKKQTIKIIFVNGTNKLL